MNNKFKAVFSFAILACSISQASYNVYVPLEQAARGHLTDNSIVFTKNTGVTTPTTPTEPTAPTVPTVPTPPPQPTRQLVAEYSFYQDTVNYSGFYSNDKLSKIYDYPEVIIIDKILENGKKYYVTNTGNDCIYTAMVCTMNVPNSSGGCALSDNNLSGQKTILKNKTSTGKVCQQSTTKQINGTYTNMFENMKIYDLPK